MADTPYRLQSALKQHPDHAQTLGVIQDTCNMIEKVGTEAVAICLSIPDEQAEAIIYSLQNSRARFDVIAAVIRSYGCDESVSKPLLDQIDCARRLFSRRNELIHGMWDSRWGKTYILKFGSRDANKRHRPVNLTQLQTLLQELEDCLNAMIDASTWLSAWKPSPEKSP